MSRRSRLLSRTSNTKCYHQIPRTVPIFLFLVVFALAVALYTLLVSTASLSSSAYTNNKLESAQVRPALRHIDMNSPLLKQQLDSTDKVSLTQEDRNGKDQPIEQQWSKKRTDAKIGLYVGEDGGGWTSETHVMKYGFNVDSGLVDLVEQSCRDAENSRNSPDSQWRQHDGNGPINGLWIAPKIVDCRALEFGPGLGVYVDSLKKDQAKKNRKVFGVEPNPMGGVFHRRNGPKQLVINILEHEDTFQFGRQIRQQEVEGKPFDLLYSIEVCEHIPPERHHDAAKFFAGLSGPGTKLIFGAAHPGQSGTGHVGNRPTREWEDILSEAGFVKHDVESISASKQMQEYNHKVNSRVYYYQGPHKESP
jgi:hypothetical protein